MSVVNPELAYSPTRLSRRTSVIAHGTEIQAHSWGPESGLPVILLHGWADCALSFQFMADLFDERYRVIAFDWRGFGDSQWAANGYWFPDYLGDLDGVLDALVPTGDVILVGHSMGGNVAGLYAGVRPERVRKLVLLEGLGLRSADPTEAPGRYRLWLNQIKQPFERRYYGSLDELADRVRRRAPQIDIGRARFVASHWAKLGCDGRYELKMDPKHKCVNPVLYRRAEVSACWSATTAPALIITGSDSDLKQKPWFDEVVDEFKACYRRCRFAEVGNAGHMLHLEQPADVVSLIVGFIEESYE